MQKKVLTEQAIYYGDVSMPKGFEIDALELSQSIFKSTGSICNKGSVFSFGI